MATGAVAMGATFIGRSAAIAEPAKPAVIAMEARSFFIVHSARLGTSLGWSRVSMLPFAAHSPTAGRIGERRNKCCDARDTTDEKLAGAKLSRC